MRARVRGESECGMADELHELVRLALVRAGVTVSEEDVGRAAVIAAAFPERAAPRLATEPQLTQVLPRWVQR